MQYFESESLSHDPLHGYIPFTSPAGLPTGEVSEQQIIDHPWLQRLRQIHQLQTAWWVFPTAEHTRFQHVMGVMYLASRVVEHLYPSLQDVCPGVPSRAYVESLMRMAALLHDVGHGPFGHFFDQHYLAEYGLNHEILGAHIIQHELGDLLRRIGRNPKGKLADGETLDPAEIALLIARPRENDDQRVPAWLRLLRSLFSGLYTVDNMDFVLRDAYMSGYNVRAFRPGTPPALQFLYAPGIDDPRPGSLGAGAVPCRQGRAVPYDLLSPDRARSTWRSRTSSTPASRISSPAIRWTISTSIKG